MKLPKLHSFFIPVMGTGFTIDTPIKVAKYGISSVISLVDDLLIEKMRKHYCNVYEKLYHPIKSDNNDPRANRIKEYLNLINDIVKRQIREIKSQNFSKNSELSKYFELLPDTSVIKKEYLDMKKNPDRKKKKIQQKNLKQYIQAGSIDVNIMTKLDRENYKNNHKLSPEYTDALAALRGYAKSQLRSSIIFSAGLNKRLFTYIEDFDNFYHQPDGSVQKQIIIKVSDYRSALVQGKFLAKKGLWISEFRIESGLNCGGHAFATKGHLIGPVLEEFKNKKNELLNVLFSICNKSLRAKGRVQLTTPPPIRITVQGGIASSQENEFLHNYYDVDATGWGTPFLLVPEATSVDQETLNKLVQAKENDISMSNVSPLNVIFQNLRTSTSELAKKLRIKSEAPGSPCPKGYLAFNTEFTSKPICTASRQYQKLKIEKLKSLNIPHKELAKEIAQITDKSCICHELGGSVLIKNKLETQESINSAICPGPNITAFTKTSSLPEMINHIYGRKDLFKNSECPNMFITELKLYIEVFRQKFSNYLHSFTESEMKYLKCFYDNLQKGIEYYRSVISNLFHSNEKSKEKMTRELLHSEKYLEKIIAQEKSVIHTSNQSPALIN